MITVDDFLKDCNGHDNAYSSYMILDIPLQKLIDTLNDINPDMNVGFGKVSDTGRSIYFEISKELPQLIHKITSKLNCKGFADIDAWYGASYFEASFNGNVYNDFTAEWQDGSPCRTDNNTNEWDAFVIITDNQSKETFLTGEGACDYDSMLQWQHLIDTH